MNQTYREVKLRPVQAFLPLLSARQGTSEFPTSFDIPIVSWRTGADLNKGQCRDEAIEAENLERISVKDWNKIFNRKKLKY